MKSISFTSSVKSIGIHAFLYSTKLEIISFKEYSKLTTIEEYVFYCCSNLKNMSFKNQLNLITIALPSQLKEISSYYNEECSKLKSIIILSNISKIGDFSFLNCSNLECIQYFGTDEPNVSQNAFQ